MKKQVIFTGCATALVTPFKQGEVDYDALDRIVEDQIARGVDALVAVGTTGEPSTLTWDEQISVIRHVIDVSNHRVPVIAGTGSNCTKEAIEAARMAKECGADAQLCVTPYYNKTSQAGLIAHYNAIADDGSLPVIVYNVPSRTGLNIAPSTLEVICQHKNVVAVKEANPDVAQAIEKLRRCGNEVAFYCGNDDLTLPLMACGFEGVISVLSNVMPETTVELTKLAAAGRNREAAELQKKLQPYVDALFCETSPIPVKAALEKLGMCSDEVRLPLIPMQPDTRAKMFDTMRTLGLLN